MVQSLEGNSLEERVAYLQQLSDGANEELREHYEFRLQMSWIYHDSAIEGVVYTQDELNAALTDQPVTETALIPVYDEIRQHRAALRLVHELAQKKRLTISADVIKDIYSLLAPEELEGKGGPKYRKDMPLHRLYFHEISQPDKIGYRMRQLVQWMNAPETKRSTHAVRLASKAHLTFLQIYPFPRQSGKVARLLLNLILMRNSYPPVILHATERQRYYEAIKAGDDAVARIVTDALGAGVESAIHFFEHPPA